MYVCMHVYVCIVCMHVYVYPRVCMYGLYVCMHVYVYTMHT